MEQTLKITNVLSDPTRFSIYQYITKKHDEVTVQEIAESFDIHPNVARLHLSKLEDINMLNSDSKKTGKGGRPSRIYRLSEEVIQLQFPFRDYQLLAKIAIDTLMGLGEIGQKALFATGKKFGQELIAKKLSESVVHNKPVSFDEKLLIIKESASMMGFYPEFSYNEEKTTIFFKLFNCPFKEVASYDETICKMHFEYLSGMFESLFDNISLVEDENMLDGCASCDYQVKLVK